MERVALRPYRWIIFYLIASVLANMVLLYLVLSGAGDDPHGFGLLAPGVARLEYEEFQERQETYRVNYANIRTSVDELIDSRDADTGFYFENLRSGAWVGIDEKKRFYPGSLLKVPIVISTLNRVDEGVIDLNDVVTVTDKDKDRQYGPLGFETGDVNYTVFELINYTLYYSDNTASGKLEQLAGKDDISDSFAAMGIPYTSVHDNPVPGTMKVSPKEYSNILRSLYYSVSSDRASSHLVLTLLSDTSFRNGLPAGLPADVRISHKTGYTRQPLQHHDCGIVYSENYDYIICVMTEGLSEKEAADLTKEISRIVYGQVMVSGSRSG